MSDTSPVDPTRASAVVIRDLREDDLDRVAELEREIFGSSAWSPALVREDFRFGASRWRGADGEESLAAYAVYGFEGDAFHLMNLAVAPEARGRRLGAALMADFMAEARRLEVREAWLEVAVTNEVALALYRAHGFEDVRVRRRYYQPEGLDALVMRVRLDDPS
ncbi:ribosomal protein S18-alanine N-acetyltransferase [Demequina muriae]|uniref:Ribosomal protein S18-alanine N-acetyltransferase n=1 Tax=Demequina muriae TaxID=3051664 RepID=A0ABT8GHG7_9MICO|nr:ribosomal protein S18-alanine N-acetyltransferase [Demequina sp. EGI L300058]MDN4480875.1 ribosomal protein S18-alanine N-acetyltransferase [Demequina sp. EGI L300058]